MILDPQYEGSPRVSYGHGTCFLRVCPECGRFVRADDSVWFNDYGVKRAANATCKIHGRVEMPFEGFFE